MWSKTILVAEQNHDLRMSLVLQLRNITRKGLTESIIISVDKSKEVLPRLLGYWKGNGICDIIVIAQEMLDVPEWDSEWDVVDEIYTRQLFYKFDEYESRHRYQLQLIEEIKDLYPAIRIVVTTASPYKEETTRAMVEVGANAVLWKPWDVKRLREALQI